MTLIPHTYCGRFNFHILLLSEYYINITDLVSYRRQNLKKYTTKHSFMHATFEQWLDWRCSITPVKCFSLKFNDVSNEIPKKLFNLLHVYCSLRMRGSVAAGRRGAAQALMSFRRSRRVGAAPASNTATLGTLLCFSCSGTSSSGLLTLYENSFLTPCWFLIVL